MSRYGKIRGEQIRDESVDSVDIASGSIKAGELSAEAISGQVLITSTDTTNDRLLIWDATDSVLKKVSPSNLGLGGGGGSPAGSDMQIQFNDGGSFGASANLTWDDTELKISGTGTSALLNLQTSEDSSTASPVLELTRVSQSPADSDYLGQIKFVGKHDGNGVTTYAKITGKIDDASANSEDGIIEFANVKGGSQTITARLRSDSLQLLNSTNLVVDGTAEISSFLYHKDDNDTFIKFEDDDINIQAGGVNFIDITEGSSNEITFNEAGADVDFRVEGDNETHLLFVRGDNDRVGIKTSSPRTDLDVVGSTTLDGSVVINESGAATGDFRVEGDTDRFLMFVDASADKIGIGTAFPVSKLHVHSDVADDGNILISQSEDSTDEPRLDLSKSRGSGTNPTSVEHGDFIGQIRFLGFVGSSYHNFADIYVQAAGTIDAANHTNKLVIRTTPLGSTSASSALTIDENQNLVSAGAVLGKMRHMTHHRYNDGSGTGKEYIPWAGTSEQPSPSWITQGVAPYNGRLVTVLVRSSKSGGLGSTEVGVHIGTDGSTVVNSTPEETVTVSMSAANTTGTFNFANANHFAAGDVIGVSIDPTNAHGNVNVTCIWEYSIS